MNTSINNFLNSPYNTGLELLKIYSRSSLSNLSYYSSLHFSQFSHVNAQYFQHKKVDLLK